MIEGGHGGQELIETIAAVGVVVGGGVFSVIAFLTEPGPSRPGRNRTRPPVRIRRPRRRSGGPSP